MLFFQLPKTRRFNSTSPYAPLDAETQQVRLLRTRTGIEDYLGGYELLQPIPLREVKGKVDTLKQLTIDD